MALSIIALVLVLWAIRELIVGTWAWIDTRKVRHERNVERTRRQFAEARNHLFRLMLEHKVNVDSVSFKHFYQINTAFMRRPDQYREISAAVAYLFLKMPDSPPSQEMLDESKDWSPEFKQVVRATADAMGYLLLDYSLFIRLMFYSEKRHDPDSTPVRMLRKLAAKVERERPVVQIRQTQKAMYSMAAA